MRGEMDEMGRKGSEVSNGVPDSVSIAVSRDFYRIVLYGAEMNMIEVYCKRHVHIGRDELKFRME
jgi:hypothetical protein